jgi:TRAP-type C4-dicarboxylate transport system permease small subunit
LFGWRIEAKDIFLEQQNRKEACVTSIAVRAWRATERTTIVLGVIATAALIALMILTTADVVFRYILGSPLKGVYEISELLFLSAVFLGLGYTQLSHEHVNVQIVIRRLPRRVNLMLETVMLLLALFIYGLLTWRGLVTLLEAISSGEYRWGLIQIPLWPARLTVPVGASALCLRFIGEMVINLRELFITRKQNREHGS